MTAGELSGKPDEMPRTTCHGLSYVWRGREGTGGDGRGREGTGGDGTGGDVNTPSRFMLRKTAPAQRAGSVFLLKKLNVGFICRY